MSILRLINTFIWRRQWHPTPVLLPGEFHGQRSQAGYSPWGHKESDTVNKAEHRRIDAFEQWCWRRLLRVPWTAERSNQSILKDISPGCSVEGMMLKLNLQYFGHRMRRVDSLDTRRGLTHLCQLCRGLRSESEMERNPEIGRASCRERV